MLDLGCDDVVSFSLYASKVALVPSCQPRFRLL